MNEREPESNSPDPKAEWADTRSAGSTTRRGLPTPQLLEQIIAAADDALQSAEKDEQLRKALDEVGRQHPTEDLNVDPVLLALVNTVIGRMDHIGPKLGPKVTEFVATTLYEDPVARVRAERLWAGIRKRARHE